MLFFFFFHFCISYTFSTLVKNNLNSLGAQIVKTACYAGDPGSIPGWGRSPGEGNGYPLQYSCMESSKDRGVWWGTVHGVSKEVNTTE